MLRSKRCLSISAGLALCGALSLPDAAHAQRSLDPIVVTARHLPLARPFPRLFSLADGSSRGRRLLRQPIALNEDQRPSEDCENTVPGTGGTAGNPIVVQTGNKVQDDVDFAGMGEMPLGLSRSYSAKSAQQAGLFGLGWASNVEHTLSFYTGAVAEPVLQCTARMTKPGECNVANPIALVLRTEFGREYRYTWNAAQGRFRGAGGDSRWIVKDAAGYTLHHDDGATMQFRTDGLVARITDDVGLGWSYTYAPGSIRIERSGGRAIAITVDAANDVATSVVDPAGNAYHYSYARPHAGALVQRLTGVDYPGTATDTRTYHYENANWPNHLTGISLGGVRHSTFAYHPDGRGMRTEHAGGAGRVTLAYGSDGGGAYTDVFNARDLRTRYRYMQHPTGVQKLDHVERDPFDGCAAAAARYTYDALGFVDRTTDWEGVQTDFDYDAEGRLVARREGIADATPQGLRYTTYAWSAGRLMRIVEHEVDGNADRAITTTAYAYGTSTTATASRAGDVRHQLRSITRESHVGRVAVEITAYTYTVFGEAPGDVRLKTIIENGPAAGDEVTTTLSGHGDVVSVSNALGHVTTYEYDARGLPTAHVDPNRHRTTLAYDARGRVQGTTRTYDGIAQTTAYERDRFGNVVSQREPGRPERRFRYDDAGRPTHAIERRHADDLRSYTDAVTEVSYDALSLPVRVRQYGSTTQLSRCEQTGSGMICTPAYTSLGPTQRHAFRAYDSAGRLVSISESRFGAWPNSSIHEPPIEPVRTTRYGYDANGRLASVIDPLSRETRFEYDALGRRSAMVDAMGQRTGIAHGFADSKHGLVRQFAVTPPNGAGTAYGYDGFGMALSIDSPDTGHTEYTYAAGGRLSTVAQADGGVLAYEYDGIGRVQRIVSNRQSASAQFDRRLAQLARKPRYAITPIGSPSTLPDLNMQSYTYDCANGIGRLCAAVHGPSYWKTTYAYGAYGRLQSREERSMAGQYALQAGYRYDTYGRLEGIDYPNGHAIDYIYAGGLPARIDATIGAQTLTVADRIAYAADGRATGYTAGNGAQWTAQFDLNGRPERIATAPVQALSYDYDPAGMLAGIVNANDASASQEYGYDALGRVEAAARPGVAESWQYDAIGNREHHVRGTRSSDLEYRGNLLTGITGATERQYTYTPTGNRQEQFDNGESTLFAYDPWGRQGFLFRPFDAGTVCEPTAGANEACTPRSSALYDYAGNWRGQRTHKAQHAITGLDARCRRGGHVPGCGPTDVRRMALTQYLFEDDGSLLTEHQTEGGTSTSNYVWLAGRPIAVIRNGTLYHVASDHLGRPEAVTDANRNIVWRARNLAFHREVTQQSASFGELNLGFPGQYYDAESNLYYNWHRYYDPSTGRYTQSDPIGLLGGLNSFSYAANDPVHHVDPHGLATYAGLERITEHLVWIAGLQGDEFHKSDYYMAERLMLARLIAGRETAQDVAFWHHELYEAKLCEDARIRNVGGEMSNDAALEVQRQAHEEVLRVQNNTSSDLYHWSVWIAAKLFTGYWYGP